MGRTSLFIGLPVLAACAHGGYYPYPGSISEDLPPGRFRQRSPHHVLSWSPSLRVHARRIGREGEGSFELLAIGRAPAEQQMVPDAATNPSSFESLWRELGVNSPLPVIDFRREVVVAFRLYSYVGNRELDALVLTLQGRLIPEFLPRHYYTERDDPEEHRVGALIISVPRSALPREGVVLRAPFTLESDSPSDTPVLLPVIERRLTWEDDPLPPLPVPSDPPPIVRLSVENTFGAVARPRVGAASLETLYDGTPVWVVDHREGGCDAFPLLFERPVTESPAGAIESGVVRWNQTLRRFVIFGHPGRVWDEYGTPVFGSVQPSLPRRLCVPNEGAPSRLLLGPEVPAARRATVHCSVPDPRFSMGADPDAEGRWATDLPRIHQDVPCAWVTPAEALAAPEGAVVCVSPPGAEAVDGWHRSAQAAGRFLARRRGAELSVQARFYDDGR